MEKKNFLLSGIVLIATALIIFSSNFASASITYSNLSLDSATIGMGQQIIGNINLTATNQDSSVLVKVLVDSIEKKSMSMLDFLNDANAIKQCSTQNCDKRFSLNSGGMLELPFNAKNNSYVGFYVQGINIEIQELDFDISGESFTYQSCGDPSFKMDILGDGVIDYEYSVPGSSKCGVAKYPSTAFSLSQTTVNTIVDTNPSCEKIYLTKTGSIDVTAIIQTGDGGGNLIAKIYDPIDTSKELGSCTMYGDDQNYTCTIGGEYSESPTFFIKDAKDYYVCLTDKQSTNAYELLTEQSAPFAGFTGFSNSQNPTKDFAIYVSIYSFSPFNGDFSFNSSSVANLKSSLQDYITTKYSGNCSQGCVFPLKFISSDENQKINITNIDFRTKIDGSLSRSRYVYNIVPSWPLVNVSNQLINFGFLNITSPTTSGSHKLTINIGSYSKYVNFVVADAPKIISLSPLQTVPNRETRFSVSAQPASSQKPISSYKWNFNDGSYEQTTTVPFILHTFANSGTYNVIVTVIDNTSISSSASFSVSTNLSYAYVAQAITTKLNALNTFSSKLNAEEFWIRDLFEINVTQLNQTTLQYKSQINSSSSQEQLLNAQQALDALAVPEDIVSGFKLSESMYYSSPDYINPIEIARITDTESEYESGLETSYKNSIALWDENNLDLGISGYVKSLKYAGTSQDKFTVLTISIDPTTADLQNVYLILQLPSGISYNNLAIRDNSTLNSFDLNDAIGFKFDSLDDKKYIYLAMPGSQDLTKIRFFASPDLSEFKGTGNTVIPEKTPPWVLIVFIILVIVAGFGVGMWFLWRDYGAKLEKKLFPNRNDLYTLMNYIASAFSSKISEGEILEKLQKAGWKKDQIKYAMKKLKKQIKEKEKPKQPTQ